MFNSFENAQSTKGSGAPSAFSISRILIVLFLLPDINEFDKSKTEYFVHVSGIIDEINEGDNVEFELKEGRKGLNAVNVKVI